MDDLKLHERSEEELESLINVVWVFSRVIGLGFGLDKCAVLVLKQGLKFHCEEVVLPDGQLVGKVDGKGTSVGECRYYAEGDEGGETGVFEESETGGEVKAILWEFRAIIAWTIGVVIHSAGIVD